MKAEFTDLSETRKNLVVEIPTAAVDSEIERLSQQYRRSVKVPGFRPGKAPVKLVRQRLRDQILQEVAQDLIPKAVDEAIKERGLEPVESPSIQDVTVEEGHPLTFTASFETLPPIDPGEYRGLTLRRPPVETTEEAVTKALEQLRQRAARLEPVANRSIAQGDIVTVDLERRPLGARGADSARTKSETHKNVEIELGGSANPPGFDDNLVGLDAGSTHEFTLTYPADHEIKELAGTDVSYTVTVKQVRERVLPDLDDALARDLGDLDTLDALTERVRADLTHQAEHEADGQVRSDLLTQLASRVQGEVPQALVTREVDRRVEHFVGQLLSQRVDPRRANIDWEAFRSEQREAATATVRSTLVIDEIAKSEQIAVDDAEIATEIERQAERNGRTTSATRALLEKEGGIDRLVTGLRREKTIDFVLSEATAVTV
jgi:trigger factor